MYMYSTLQIQGIKQTRFAFAETRLAMRLHAFCVCSKRVWRRVYTRFAFVVNAFGGAFTRVSRLLKTRLAMRLHAFRVC